MRYRPQDLLHLAKAAAAGNGRDIDHALERMRRSRRQFRDQLVDDEPNPSADAYFLFLRNLKLSLSGCSSLNELRLVFDKRMTALGLTSRDVSERAQVSKSTVNRILKGDAIPRLLTLCSLADALGVDLEIS